MVYYEAPEKGIVLLNFEFTLKKPKPLDEMIVKTQIELSGIDPNTPEYNRTVARLTELYKLKEMDTSRKRISPEAVLGAATNLLGIGLILNHEKLHVITTKALGFVKKS